MESIKEVIVVEGRYDKNTLRQIVNAVVIETEGFGIFNDRQKQKLLRSMAEKRGLIVLTDPDGAGFVIRSFIKYGYADLKANAQIGQKLVTAAELFGKGGFEDSIRALADFYAARMAEGELPEYWHYKGEIKTTAASSETKKEVAAFLKAAAELLGDSSLTELAGTL